MGTTILFVSGFLHFLLSWIVLTSLTFQTVKMSQVAGVLHAQRVQVDPERQIPSLPTGSIEMIALLLNNDRYLSDKGIINTQHSRP